MGIEIVYIIGAAIFGVALIYAVNRRKRSPEQKAAGDAATRRLYEKQDN